MRGAEIKMGEIYKIQVVNSFAALTCELFLICVLGLKSCAETCEGRARHFQTHQHTTETDFSSRQEPAKPAAHALPSASLIGRA